MKIAVVTPAYVSTYQQLERCIVSVAAQTASCTHYLVLDGCHPPLHLPAAIKVITLPSPHSDYGNAARGIGTAAAIADGCDAIAYLDSDNWYHPSHIEDLTAKHRATGAAVCSSSRFLVDLDGNLLGRCAEVDGVRFVDTNCMFFTRAAYGLLPAWYLMSPDCAAVGDRLLWELVRRSGVAIAHTGRPTVNCTTKYESHYSAAGRIPPMGAFSARSPQVRVGEWFTKLLKQHGSVCADASFQAATKLVKRTKVAHNALLVVCTCGDRTPIQAWNEHTPRPFDLALIDHGSKPLAHESISPDYYFQSKGYKWQNIADFLECANLTEAYQYYWFPDDDVSLPFAGIAEILRLMKQNKLRLCQPSLSPDSFVSWKITRHRNGQAVRYTNMVEVMCPFFRCDSLAACFSTFRMSRSGWGLDFVWPKLLFGEGVGIIDAVQATHMRPVASGRWVFDDGTSPHDEMKELLSRFGMLGVEPREVTDEDIASGSYEPAGTT